MSSCGGGMVGLSHAAKANNAAKTNIKNLAFMQAKIGNYSLAKCKKRK